MFRKFIICLSSGKHDTKEKPIVLGLTVDLHSNRNISTEGLDTVSCLPYSVRLKKEI
jgi:hypothetical protein